MIVKNNAQLTTRKTSDENSASSESSDDKEGNEDSSSTSSSSLSSSDDSSTSESSNRSYKKTNMQVEDCCSLKGWVERNSKVKVCGVMKELSIINMQSNDGKNCSKMNQQ